LSEHPSLGSNTLILVLSPSAAVFFTGAFHAPASSMGHRSGLFFDLFSNFTGYLLPWDQLAFWAITICTGMLEYIPGIGLWLQGLIQGGPEVGPGTLSNFYAIHTAILPASLLILMPFHFWRTKGGDWPRGRTKPEIAAVCSGHPHLLLRRSVALVLLASVLVFYGFERAAGARPIPASAEPDKSAMVLHGDTRNAPAPSPPLCALRHPGSLARRFACTPLH
jgi:quinol-cytochrome oxidoreductase complex cytochrome b subunit